VNSLIRLASIASAVILLTGVTKAVQKPAQHLALESADGLDLHNVAAEPATLQGKKGIKVTTSQEALRKLKELTPEGRSAVRQLAVVKGVVFSSGVIEAEIAGAPEPGTFEGARGFVGVSFRVQDDITIHDEFYLRPTNGRADDQERRNHAAQYVSSPDWPWFRLRKETPSKYESYVDLVPGEWTKVKIEVKGDKARLYVHGSEQPTLIVNDVKSGANAKGAIGLSIGPGTIAHFRNLTITADSASGAAASPAR
jgi:hypothetical protein